jgi:hypothetical protein
MQKLLLAAGLAALLATMGDAAHAAANAEPLEIDPAVLSKMALERAKNRSLARNADRNGARDALEAGAPTAECGSVNIGNVITGGRPGFQPREITVVITGDVINANNKCN